MTLNTKKGNRYEEIGLVMNGLMKAFIVQDKFSGNFEEDLDTMINVFQWFADMCDFSADEMRTSMPIM